MNNVHRLLDDLNNMVPLSAGFWNDLQPMVTEKHKKNNYVFLKPGRIANKGWQLVSGFILVIRTTSEGEEIVEKIYYPKDVVADLNSFVEEVPVRFKFIAVGPVTVLEIERSDVMKLLLRYPETNKLIQHITLIEKKATEELVQLLRLPEKDRVIFFMEHYPIQGLPEQYCASILNLPVALYSAYAQTVLSSSLSQPERADHSENKDDEYSNQAYKIKRFIIDHHTSPEINHSQKIAASFNMTTVTLNRLFLKTFGYTVHKFVIKCKMTKALELLENGDLPVGKIGLAVGYQSIFHFSKVFKAYYGYPPKKHRRIKKR